MVTANMWSQPWMHLHYGYAGKDWVMPVRADESTTIDFLGDDFSVTMTREDSTSLRTFLPSELIDSITYLPQLTDDEKGHNHYRVFTMNIVTEDNADIATKEDWINCHITIDGLGEYSDYSGTARIKGRGNSSWLHYKKKPYKFKLDDKSKLLGMGKAKNWNLLSNYRDVTDMMNVFGFEVARHMGIPYPNSTRFVEVFLNGEYVGVYQLTEKIELGNNRVEINKEGGILLGIDLDDGPSLSPNAGDNFWSDIFNLPICVKEPEDASHELLDSIREDFAQMEIMVKTHDYNGLDSLLDIPSFIKMLQMQELLRNVEICAPRSIFVHKEQGGKYIFGPAWDWDAAYGFNWENWETGHKFFDEPYTLMLGTRPGIQENAYGGLNPFWSEMFNNKSFVSLYKELWQQFSPDIINTPWIEVQHFVDEMTLSGAYTRDTDRWPLQTYYSSNNGWGPQTLVKFKPAEELEKMLSWLKIRKNNLDNVIAAYPSGTDKIDEFVEIKEPVVEYSTNSVTVTAQMDYSLNYSQNYQIMIDGSKIQRMLGGTPSRLVAINADGSEGSNTAAGTYGAWFDDRGTQSWSRAHVYIESDDLYSWNYGCHPDNCEDGHSHTARMQYRRGQKRVTVTVNFTIQ